jgi:TetR/AcrR family transcriptional regulator, acrAB operon repressor
MVKRTKEDAEKTRLAIITAARKTFAEKGVTKTSLDDVAKAAGVTRGAIYWHFEDKNALFYAMKHQTALPLIDKREEKLSDADPFTGIENMMVMMLESIENDENTRTCFEIMNFRCEYVNELQSMLPHMMSCLEDLKTQLTHTFTRAAQLNQLNTNISPEMAATLTCVFLYGLFRTWLADEHGTIIRSNARQLIQTHLLGLRQNKIL